VALSVEHERVLAPFTTLSLGGPARHFVQADTRGQLFEALDWAAAREEPVGILGGGSNLVISDDGFPGLVVRVGLRGIELARASDHALLTVQAGEPWDDVVELAVSEGLAGIECLSGIPGSTGATPIQNVGAYGQEVSEVIDAVELLDRESGRLAWLPGSDCGFGYRDSRFKREPGRYVVLAVRLRLRCDGKPRVRYGELTRVLAASHSPSLREVQQAVRALRAAKGMLIGDGYVASAGSFFTNPIVTTEEAERIVALARERRLVSESEQVPRFAVEGGVKLAAGWLVERAGIGKGVRRGAVGVSERHALALVHHGAGTTRELLSVATEIQQQVFRIFGVSLQLEPVRWGP